MRYINGGKVTTMDEVHDVYLPRMASYSNAAKGWGLWKVSIKETEDFIGWILVRPMGFFGDNRDDSNLELGWRLMRKAWGHGYATEAATAVMNRLESTGVAHFTALAMEGNAASINVMKKLGMRYVKTAMHQDPIGDDICVYYERVLGK